MPFIQLWRFFVDGGWIVVVASFLLILWEYRMLRLKKRYIDSTKFILLAIDVPREVEPNLKAIEHIYSQFAGIYSTPNFIEKYVKGQVQLYISLELVSIGGYIQFIIRTPEKYRDLVESAFYAQYPEAEITEVEDYTKDIPNKFPNDKYELLGSGISFNKPNPYPIKTYVAFEHSLSQQLADPMAGLLEILSKLKQGEQMWIQMVIRPKGKEEWVNEAKQIVNKIIGEKKDAKPMFGAVGAITKGTYETVTASLFEPAAEEKAQPNQPKNWMMQLTPGEKATVEAIQMKVAKKAYETKFRYVYVAEKELVNKGLGINAFFGALNQFTAIDLNSFRPDSRTFTKTNYILFKKMRFSLKQRQLIKNYKDRQPGKGIVLNTEELASVFHFPTLTVKAPLVRKIDSKRGEPPTSLPIEGVDNPIKPVNRVPQIVPEAPAKPSVPPAGTKPASRSAQPETKEPPTIKKQAPPNLPFE